MSQERHDTNLSFSLSSNLLLPHPVTVTVLLHPVPCFSLHHGLGHMTLYVFVLTTFS